MLKLLILNGPNLNLLGSREPSVYGNQSFESYFNLLIENNSNCILSYKQSNIEGEIIDFLQHASLKFDGVILNAAGYTHTSVAIADAVAAIVCPAIEVHISNVYAREDYRHVSLMAKHCKGVIAGFGLSSYQLAIDYFLKYASLKQ